MSVEAGTTDPLLNLTGITKRFPGIWACRNVSLQARAGEIVGILGENGAGKSTLMNIAAGLLRPDGGEIEFEGHPAVIRNPMDAKRLGIGMVHQHFMLVPTMTVAENAAIGNRPERPPLSDLKRVAALLSEVSERYGFSVDPNAKIEDLSVGARQRVEILRVLAQGAKLLILDEPTSVLTPQEWEDLSSILSGLASEGKGIIFITHKFDELFAVADRCVVMRDGEVIGGVAMKDATKPSLAKMMVGRDVVLRVEPVHVSPGKPVLSVNDVRLCDERGRNLLEEIDFEIREGEILGVAGVDGNGQDELVAVLSGLVPPTSGEIRFRGSPVPTLSPLDFIRLGGAVIPADRHKEGVVLDLSVEDNLMMSDFWAEGFSSRGWLRRAPVRERTRRLISEFDIRTPSASVLMRQLSGGNQQRVVLARELDRYPKLLIAAQPTAGLDVGAVEFVYGRITQHKKNGGATLLISTELDEILSLADRVAVMVGGRVLDILDAAQADAETLGLLMAGGRAT
ncbi:MAG: ABC transporter ATP-binding protein [Acidimicrobiia bacterium]